MMKRRLTINLLLGVAFALGLSGCDTVQHARKTEADVSAQSAMIDSNLDRAARAAVPNSDVVKYLDQQYVSLAPVTKAVDTGVTSQKLKCRIDIATDQPISILEAAQIVSRECKVSVRVTADALQQLAGANFNQMPGQQGMGQMPNMPAGAPGAPLVGQIGGQSNFGQANRRSADSTLIDINYSGEGDGFMDMICARAGGLSWRRDDNGTYRIYALDTRTFAIASMASDESTMASNFQSGTTSTTGVTGGAGGAGAAGGGGASGSGSNSTMQTSVVKLKADLWTDIQNTLNTIAGQNNATVARSMSSVTVRGSVDTLEAVKEYVDFQNKRLGKQVQFAVKIYSVTSNNGDSAGINWDAVYGTLTGKFGLSLAGSAFSAPTNAVNAGFSVLKTSGSPWAGTQAIVSALNEQGRAKLERSQVLSTLNFQPVATQIGTQKGYVAGTQTTQTAQVGSQTSIQMGTINVGFSLSLFPYVQDNNDIMAHFNLNLSNLDRIREVKANGSTAEAPEISLPINTVQKVRISPGDTLMLTGLNNVDDSSTRSGTGVHWNWVLGGGVDAQASRSSMVVLITPVLID